MGATTTAAIPCAGLSDPVHDAQRAFRAALDALARPGRIQRMGQRIPGLALGAAMAHLLLALTDDDTPVWWQSGDGALADWLRFHTGAPAARQPGEAAYAVITDPATLAPLDAFAQGTLESPEQSCTLLIEAPSLTGGPALTGFGPGIATRQPIAVAGLRDGFWREWQINHAAFPQGVDIFFTCGDQALGLPRTTRIARLEEV
jgi:alpha-D-ribose 1-methylphosphonate 5-triphosphate synthase subunit PhnH